METLKTLQRYAVLLSLIEKMLSKGSWCGETHIQKTVYFLEKLVKVPLQYEFVFYKHGPFSFDLRDEITAMRADGLLDLMIKSPEYGPSIVRTETGESLQRHFPKTIRRHSKKLDSITEWVGDKGVADLERLSTALYVTLDKEGNTDIERAHLINKLKPHVPIPEAIDAVQEIDRVRKEIEAVI